MLWCILNRKVHIGWMLKKGKYIYNEKCKHKKADVATLKSDKVDFKRKVSQKIKTTTHSY